MANTTTGYHLMNQTLPSIPMTEQPVWILSQTINSILIIISVWLIVSVGVYGCRSGKFDWSKNLDCSGGLVLIVAFLATVSLLPRLLATQAVILVGFNKGSPEADFDCEVAEDVSIAIYYISLFPVYFFLWLRQRSLFHQPSIKRLYNRLVQVFSWGCLLFLMASGIGIIIIFVLPLAYMSSDLGCVLRYDQKDNVVGFYILMFVLVSGQLVLLGLFVYPLHRHRKVSLVPTLSTKNPPQPSINSFNFSQNGSAPNVSKEVLNDSENETSSQTYEKSKKSVPLRQSLSTLRRKISLGGLNRVRSTFRSDSKRKSCNTKTAKRLLKVMKRSITCAVVCIASDFISLLVVGFLLPRETSKSLTNTVFDVSLLINVVSLIVSYKNYKNILFAPFLNWNRSSKPQFVSSISHTANDDSKS